MPKKKSYRVEATIPAIQWVEASSPEEAKRIACEKRDGWDIDLGCDIDEDHVVDVQADDDTLPTTLKELLKLPKE